MSKKSGGLRIHITGIVQGVGFRPFIYNLATRHNLPGWVRNTAAGVDIEADGTPAALEAFVAAIRREAPPLARIDTFETTDIPAQGFTAFEIVHSESQPGDFIPISPDVCICPDCLRELFDPADRRYRYPFINCTNCGPRFTIIASIPYDRPNTTMKDFPLCDACAAEYHNPTNRRFHAQPVACAACGPRVWLEGESSTVESQKLKVEGSDKAIATAQEMLAAGRILAIKGLGGFHLACDATNAEAVRQLRRRKLRVDKAFAVMLPDTAAVEQHCYVSPAERDLLESRQRPIVVLRRRPASPIAAQVAPGQETIGVMLPYTPLHYLLFANAPISNQPSKIKNLVMTSGNLSEEPIATDNDEARQHLASLCDAFLMHDRPIRTRCDDSVTRVVEGSRLKVESSPTFNLQPSTLLLRRSRGYAPDPIRLPFEIAPLLAAGPELKNTFCLGRGRYAFLSHHIGDLENYETLQSFEDGIGHFERVFRVRPEAIAYDLHPNYLATRYALERAEREGIPAIGVQHHHAHIAAVMADNGLDGSFPVIGVAFDGTGYGTDGNIWGSEFLIADYRGVERAAHLAYFPLPGGDAATREPWRVALALLWQNNLAWENLIPEDVTRENVKRDTIRHQLTHRINTPLTSSMGRLFDGVAALAGVRQAVNYEAQAAIEFEAMVDEDERGAYFFDVKREDATRLTPHASRITLPISPAPLLHALLADLHTHTPTPLIAARFHNGVAEMVRQVVTMLRQETGIAHVALSGGVWQNITLLTKTVRLLQAAGFTVLTHHQVPPNDGGVALGQMVIAAKRS
jgi:hydrogenase maturation protein HypF